jgi:hypothetical protein
MQDIIQQLFSISGSIRYVALYTKGQLHSSSRGSLENESSAESDKYEELIVNPVILKLVTQRGNIDCGGAEYVIIRYGSFYEFVKPLGDGHLSVGIELNADLMNIVSSILQVKI